MGYVKNSFWDIEASGQATSAGGIGLTTAEMHGATPFLEAGWDLIDETPNGTHDYWQTSPGSYPQLCCHIGHPPVMPEGSGTHEEPYLIGDTRDLGAMWFKPRDHYRLETSIDLSGMTWAVPVVPWLGGSFDGSGRVISHLCIHGTVNDLGFFGRLSPEAVVSNLGVEAREVMPTAVKIAMVKPQPSSKPPLPISK